LKVSDFLIIGGGAIQRKTQNSVVSLERMQVGLANEYIFVCGELQFTIW